MSLAKTFGKNIRRVRIERDLSQEALADAVGLAPTYVGQIERGQRKPGVAANPTLEVVERFAKVLKVKPLDLLQ
jgi:transcriptional regulator with XRE-family HTH domain